VSTGSVGVHPVPLDRGTSRPDPGPAAPTGALPAATAPDIDTTGAAATQAQAGDTGAAAAPCRFRLRYAFVIAC
jgi:hypothetical protein